MKILDFIIIRIYSIIALLLICCYCIVGIMGETIGDRQTIIFPIAIWSLIILQAISDLRADLLNKR